VCGCAGLFISLSELKALRRAAANQCLDSLRHRSSSEGLSSTAVLPDMLKDISSTSSFSASPSARAIPDASSHLASSSEDRPSTSGSSSTRNRSSTATSKGTKGQSIRPRKLEENADSSSGSRRSGKIQQQQQQQGQLRLLCRTMAQVGHIPNLPSARKTALHRAAATCPVTYHHGKCHSSFDCQRNARQNTLFGISISRLLTSCMSDWHARLI